MEDVNSFSCRYCKAFFTTLRQLDLHVETFHNSSDSEREDMGNNMVDDVYNSSQEDSDNESVHVPVVFSKVNKSSDEDDDVTDVDTVSDVVLDDDRDLDFVPENSKLMSKSKASSKSKLKVKSSSKVKSKRHLESKKCCNQKQVCRHKLDSIISESIGVFFKVK